ncbi:hypothetical protein LSH36_376g03000 [Paralvinella palmiformis]|uniref:Uncharacterized protein n=1 Tax=Paralvinella palmiformis TaxID=53620 RepID=A0AAD9JDC1_9ANNE|nr:hypothetical protein LSH36_376g03000 [Paralvinella palmiformis]
MSDPEGKDCCGCRNAHWEDLGMHGVRRLVRGKGSCARQYQLDLLLNAEEYEYCELTNQRVGVLIIIHEANSSPFLWPTHVMASPGMHTHVEIHSSRVSHSDVRYKVCTEIDEYTQTGCQAACLYQLIVDRCGCTPYWSLKHQSAHFDVSTCSLHSHLNCVQRQVSELTTDSHVSICHCDTSCEYTVYTAPTSVSHISRRDYRHYVTDKHFYTVSNSLLQAENIRARTYGEHINQHILTFSRSLEDFRYQVDTLKRNLQQVQQNVNGLMDQMYKRTWFHYHVGLNGIEKIFKHGFLPQWKLVDVQFLQPLVTGFQVMLFSYDNVVTKMDMTSPNEVAMRRTMYLSMDEQLNVGMELAIQGLDNFTKIYYSLLDMKPTTSYIVTPERRYDASLLPIEATREVSAVLRAQFTAISDLLARYMEQILTLRNVLKDLYISHSGLNRTAYEQVKEAMRQTALDLQTHVELFRTKAVYRLQEIIELQSGHFKKQNDSLFSNWARLAASLDNTVHQLDMINLDQYPHIVELGQDGEMYVNNIEKPLSDLAEAGLSNAVADSVDLLADRISGMKARSESVAYLWQKLEEHYLTVWRSMLNEQSLKDLYTKLNRDVKNIAQNPSTTNNLRAVFAHNKMLGKSSVEISSLDPDEFFVLLNADLPTTSVRTKQSEIREAIGQFQRLTDVSLQLQDFDRQLRQSYNNIRNIFQDFTQRSSLNEDFIGNNIISLSIKMAADGHERITETSAYTIYHLLRDIGILLLLFLGASIITIVEMLDIIVTCICCSRLSNKDKQSNVIKSSPPSPDTLPCSTRHVTFQFPTENHIGSPTKPALKRPKIEYYPGEIDIQTNIDDSHTEIL